MKRDGRSEEQVKSIIRNQMPEEEKVEKSDFVVVNDGKQPVIQQVLSIHENLKSQISG